MRADITATIPDRGDRNLAIVDHGSATLRPVAPHIAVVRAPDASTVWAGQELIASLPSTVANLGIAVDIGTTTLVVALVDLESGDELAVASALNPQTAYGHDVLSRIHFATGPDGLLTMQRALVDGLNALIGQVCRRAGVDSGHIHEAVLGGNTCMLHIDPSSGEPLQGDAPGEMILTTLRKRARPMIRFRTGDIVQRYPDGCSCGRTHVRFKVLGRRDDMFIVSGVNVFPSDIEYVARNVPGLTGEYRVVVYTENHLTRFDVEVERSGDFQGADEDVAEEVKKLGLLGMLVLFCESPTENRELHDRSS